MIERGYSRSLIEMRFIPCRQGFEPERVEAILHKIEIGLKHQTTQFGLHLGVVSLTVLQLQYHCCKDISY